MNANIPRCPQCGEPARVIIVIKARVRCQIRDNGKPGPIISASRDVTPAGYECGGGHTWEVQSA